MHFDKFYLEDNFVPDYVSDPYRRKKVGVSMCIKDGESMDNAIAAAETFIREYIEKNTIVSHSHIEEIEIPIISNATREILNASNPYGNGETLEQQITSCDDVKVLESYKFIAKKDPQLQLEYDKRMYILTSLK